jgi:hypothetical protein
MKKTGIILLLSLTCLYTGFGQVTETQGSGIFFQGIIRDASTLSPLPNSQIIINRTLNSVSDKDGTFSFRGSRKDTVVFSMLGYKSAVFHINDTLAGREFLAGVYLKADTITIGEVIIIPRLGNLKYEILNNPVSVSPEIENAKYNMALSAYQGKVSQGKLGDPAANYGVLHQQQRTEAYERGGIPSDRIVGLSPFMLLPAAYLLLNGLPPRPAPMKSTLTRQELDQIHKKYLEAINKRK